MMTTRTWSLCSDLDGVGTAMITSRVMSVPSSAHSRRVANPSRSPRQADFADPLGVGLVNTNAGSETRREWRSCGLRCCMGDGGLLALQSRLAEEGSKPRQGALAEDLVNMNAESEAMMEGVGGLVDCGAGRVMEVVWPSGAAVRTEAPNHHEGRWLMTVVLSVVGKGGSCAGSVGMIR